MQKKISSPNQLTSSLLALILLITLPSCASEKSSDSPSENPPKKDTITTDATAKTEETTSETKSADKAPQIAPDRENFTEGADAIGEAPADTNKAITAIRAEYKRINDLDLEERSFESRRGMELGYGGITYFYEDGQLVKIIEEVTYAESCGNQETSEYYYKNGKLFFIFTSYYDCDGEEPETTEYRYYFANNNLIRKKINDKMGKIDPLTDEQKVLYIADFYTIKNEKKGAYN
ncbi:MAG: hypothetical protein R2799_14640 [Crocinitomicaceae bacterium]